MALVLRMLYKEFYYYIVECKDSRTENFFLMGSPLKIGAVIAAYLYFIKKWGPKYMEDKKPYELKYTLMVYNLFQVIANLILGTVGFFTLSKRISEFNCLSILPAEDGMVEAKLFYYYYLLKVTDLLDTVFFVLRKKYNQATFLHIYHHVIMTVVSYIIVQYIPGGHGGVLGVINCYVHCIMYFYYFLTAFKPELKQSIWWKKHITQVQMIQFALLIVHFVRPFFTPNCSYPKFWLAFAALQNTYMLLMFGDFYRKSYLKKDKTQKVK